MLSRRSLVAGGLVAGTAALFARPARAQPLVSTPPGSTPAVSTALVLAADVSSSMDEERFALQRTGYAQALADPRVIAAIQGTAHGGIGLCYLEWADGNRQHVLVPWTRVQTVADGERIAAILDRAPRPFDGSTDFGCAIRFAADLFARMPFSAAERVIDVSGDGLPSDDDERPDAARDRAVALGIRINGLTISDGYVTFPGQPTLAEYYEEHVKGGPNAFVIEASSFETFGAALVAKLCREIA